MLDRERERSPLLVGGSDGVLTVVNWSHVVVAIAQNISKGSWSPSSKTSDVSVSGWVGSENATTSFIDNCSARAKVAYSVSLIIEAL